MAFGRRGRHGYLSAGQDIRRMIRSTRRRRCNSEATAAAKAAANPPTIRIASITPPSSVRWPLTTGYAVSALLYSSNPGAPSEASRCSTVRNLEFLRLYRMSVTNGWVTPASAATVVTMPRLAFTQLITFISWSVGRFGVMMLSIAIMLLCPNVDK